MISKISVVSIFVLFFYSCINTDVSKPSLTNVSKEDSLRIISNYQKRKSEGDIADKRQKDSSLNHFFSRLQFPDLKTVDHESYIFYLAKPDFAQPDFVFLLEKLSKDQYKLTSKVVFYPPYHTDTFYRVWNNKKLQITDVTAVQTTVQRVSSNDWGRFKTLVNGSYYWALADPCPNGDGIVDGETYGLISMAPDCSDGNLVYHDIGIHVPNKGSFRDACEYIMKLSDLRKYIANR